MKLSNLLHDLGIKWEDTTDNNREDPEILGICCDSRRVMPGDLFLCLKGKNDDGERYVGEALERGAAAVIRRLEDGRPLTMDVVGKLAGYLYAYPDETLTMIGVTGTNGKTTTTWLIHRCLEALGVGCGLIGTVAYVSGKETYPSERTTPPPDQLYRFLQEMKDNGLRACSMEVSSQGLALGRVKGLRFRYGVFTNLTEDHLDFHGTMEDYYQAKKLLFSQVEQLSLINVDDPWGKRLYQELKDEGRPVRGVSLEDPEAKELNMKLPGRFNVMNGLMAWHVCCEITGDRERTKRVLEEVSGVPGRLEPVENCLGKKVIVDYAHTPDALEKVLQTVRDLIHNQGKLICVFGCGGNREKEKRPVMGEISGRLADYTIITSDNPRWEKPGEIAEQIQAGICPKKGCYEILLDRKKAIEKALTLCGENDIVVIAGKGHETTQTIENTSYSFDDRQMVRQLAKERKESDLDKNETEDIQHRRSTI